MASAATLYYRAPGDEVRQRNLRSSEGLAIDIKADAGAVVIVPPSVRPSSGRPYAFVRGSWSDLASLPVFPSSAKERYADMAEGKVYEGSRNDDLFSKLPHHASRHGCDSLGTMEAVAHLLNERDCMPPLPWGEITKVASSAWKKHSSGENWVGQGRRLAIRDEDYLALYDSSTP